MPLARLLIALICCFSLNVNAGLPFMSETVSWKEEVLLANGQLLLVQREVTYGPDEFGRSGRGQLKEQSIRFSHNGKKVKWENDDHWLLQRMPDILDIVGDTPVLVIPVDRWGPCNKYDFPQEGLAALAYRDGDWRRIPLAELPVNLKVNLLRTTHAIQYWKEYKGKQITPQDRLKLESGGGTWGTTRQGQSILEAGKFHAAREESCARIRPLPNPQLDEAAEKNIEAETNAPILTAQVTDSSDSSRTVSSDDYRMAKGYWTGSGYVGTSCKEIVKGIRSIRQYRDGGSWHMVGHEIVLKNGVHIPIKQPGIKWAQAPASMEAVVCGENGILAVKRQNKEQLIVHRFAQTGNLIDALRVNLPDISKFFPVGKWPMVWEVQAMGEDMTITLGNYSYTGTANQGGVLEQNVTYTVHLPK